MMSMWRSGALVMLTVVGSAAAAAAQDPDGARARRVDSLFASYDSAPSPGLAVAVVRDGKVVLRRGYGLADLEHGVKITPTTVFDVASVSKQFAGMAVAMLATEGKIKLGDDIRKYIPEMQPRATPITIDHLARHTSGLRDWPGTLAVAGWRFDDVISFDQILRMAYAQRSLNFVPGAEYLYSNTGYNLLAEMVRRVSGRPFRAFTEERIFRPLGMVQTRFVDDHTEVIPNRAFGYARADSGRWSHVPNALTALGSSSMFSSVDDLARWLINFDEMKVGGKEVLTLMRTPRPLNSGAPNPYAFGLVGGDRRGVRMYNHSGSWAAFSTFVVHFPEQKLGVVVLANSSTINAQTAAMRTADIFLDQSSPAVSAAGTMSSTATVGPVSVPAATLREYEGLYRLGPGWYTRIRSNGTTLTTQATREDAVPMTARSDREFWVEGYQGSMTFVRDTAGKVTHLEYRGRPAPRVEESAPAATGSLAAYAGRYESEELGTYYTVVVRDSVLELHHFRHGVVPLERLRGEEFGSATWFLRGVEFERDRSGRVVGLVINGDARSRDIRFAKAR
jgi:CubicO group peptidase (beta-lactamase class C family)